MEINNRDWERIKRHIERASHFADTAYDAMAGNATLSFDRIVENTGKANNQLMALLDLIRANEDEKRAEA